MEFQSVCLGISAPKFSSFRHRLSIVRLRSQRFGLGTLTKCLESFEKKSFLPNLKKEAVVCCSSSSSGSGSGSGSSSNGQLKYSGRGNSISPMIRFNSDEPFRGKSGSVSFHGLTHQLIEERKLVSAPFNEKKGSFLWILGPVALILSLILPQFLIGPIFEILLRNDIVIEIVSSLVSEVLFYIGLATFLLVTDHVQRPYLQFSAKRWSLITGLRGYLSSMFFSTGLKVIIPLLAVFVSWPAIGLPAFAAVAPILIGCAAQLGFEAVLDRRGSSCWPLVPIIFEVYRIYQLTRATHFLQGLLIALKDLPSSSQKVASRGTSLIAMILTFQLLGIICLWSLLTFLMRLFPSRPVSENY